MKLKTLLATLIVAAPLASHGSPLWTTDFSGVDDVSRLLINTNGDPLFTDALSGVAANLIFSDTTFTAPNFKNVSGRTMFSPNTNVDNPGAASPQNGGSWQSEFRYTGGSQTIQLDSVVFDIVRTNSSGATQTTDTVVRDVLLTAEYSLDGGASWLAISAPQVMDTTLSITGAPDVPVAFNFSSPLLANLSAEDLWIRFKAENANLTAGAYVNVDDLAFNGAVVPEPSSLVALLGGVVLLAKGRARPSRGAARK